MQYEEDGSGNAAISDTGVTDFISNPLEVDPAFVTLESTSNQTRHNLHSLVV